MQLHGIHHLTAITADARANHRFYTEVLGLRLVKKTVNQDDVSAYHLFYADGEATPGTDLTFFEWPVPLEKRGTHSISRTGMRVAGRAALDYWHQRFTDLAVKRGDISEIDDRLTLDFEDHEGQRFQLIDSGRTVHVAGHQQDLAALLAQVPRELSAEGCLTGTLQAAHEHHRGIPAHVDARALPAHQLG